MDIGSIVVSVVTLALFVAALFTKGITHDLFLEAGIFLVSVKIILLSHGNRVNLAKIEEKIDRILAGMENSRHGETSSGMEEGTNRF